MAGRRTYKGIVGSLGSKLGVISDFLIFGQQASFVILIGSRCRVYDLDRASKSRWFVGAQFCDPVVTVERTKQRITRSSNVLGDFFYFGYFRVR